MNRFQDIFISYGRADSLQFSKYLNDRLVTQGYSVWYDFDDLPQGVDYQKQIDDAIEKSDNFLFIISPHAANSSYCRREIELAVSLNKRLVPIMHMAEIDRETWLQRNPDKTDQEWDAFQATGQHSSVTNLHPELRRINWNQVSFKAGVNDFEQPFQALIEIFERQRDYVHQHTILLNAALEWKRNQKQTQYLLIGEERQQAEAWLATRFKDEQAPCVPTDLHCEFITESIKNANNMMTQAFLCHAEQDREIAEQIRYGLMRSGLTAWSHQVDIASGADFPAEIARGVEEADNVIFFMSPHAFQFPYCQQALDHALALNKRIIPIRAREVDSARIPIPLQNLQYIDLTDNQTETDYQQDESDLLRILQRGATYYNEHKVLLTKALKWERQRRNPCVLLQGYELQHAAAWVKVASKRDQHGPTPLQVEFITESERQPSGISPDVFVSYSRADSDFARKLNDALQRQEKRTWFDQESIASGADFQQEIYRGIEVSTHFLFILSPRSIKSPYCADEVEYAASLNKRIVTVLHRPVETADLHPELAKVQWIDFNDQDRDFAANFQDLIRTLDTDPEHLQTHTRLLVRAIEWEKKQRRNDFLLQGGDLTEAEQWLLQAAGKEPNPTALQGEYIATSRKASAHRQRTLVGALGSLLFLAVLGGGVAAWQYGVARRQVFNTEILAQSLKTDNLLLSNLNIEALINGLATARQVQHQGTNTRSEVKMRAAASLLQAIHSIKEKNRLIGHTDSVWEVRFSPDGQTLASASNDGTVRLWRRRDGAPLATLIGHTDVVWDLRFSPDGQTLASASKDGTVRLWRRDGSLIATLTGHTDVVWEVRFSPDGQTLASASSDGTVRLWRRRDGAPLATLTGHMDVVWDVRFSPDGQALASASSDGTVRLWRLDGAPLATFTGHTNIVGDVRFSPDGQVLASTSGDRTVRLWQLDGSLIATLIGHTDMIRDVRFSPDGQILASASDDGTVRLWRRRDGAPLATLTGHTNKVWKVLFSPDGQILASASDDHTVRLWRRDGAPLVTLTGHTNKVGDVRFSSDGQTLASASNDGTVRLWRREGSPITTLTGHRDQVGEVRFSPDGQTLASASNDGTVRLWRRDGSLITTLTGHMGPVYDVRFSPDGQTLASVSTDGAVRLWRRDGAPISTLTDHTNIVRQVRFSPDGQTFVSTSDDRTVRLWRRDGALIATLTGHTGIVGDVRFSPDGQVLASASGDRTVRLWRRDGASITTLTGHTDSVGDVRFSPDGQVLASASDDRTVRLWRRDGAHIATLTGHMGPIYDVRFSPDGQTLASASRDGAVRLWRRDGAPITTLTGHTGRVYDVRFSPDGQTLASASYDRTVRLWQTDGAPIATLTGHTGRVYDIRFSPDGQTLASASWDGTVRLWNFNLDALIVKGCDWLREYMTNPITPPEEKALCSDNP